MEIHENPWIFWNSRFRRANSFARYGILHYLRIDLNSIWMHLDHANQMGPVPTTPLVWKTVENPWFFMKMHPQHARAALKSLSYFCTCPGSPTYGLTYFFLKKSHFLFCWKFHDFSWFSIVFPGFSWFSVFFHDVSLFFIHDFQILQKAPKKCAGSWPSQNLNSRRIFHQTQPEST